MEAILYPLIGGLLIGLSSSLMLGGLGRITGISGILGSTLTKPTFDNLWRYNFIAGIVLGGIILYKISPNFFAYELSAPIWKIILAGLLVGYGTRLGSGCTSGHGVCGLPRLAKRSFVATITFMFFGMLTVFIERIL